jgi:hypothetical protein
MRKLVMVAVWTFALSAISFCAIRPVLAQVAVPQVSTKYGLSLAPVPLNLKGKNKSKVALGSYLVNAIGDCNGCHTNPPYVSGGNPFLGQPAKINSNGYLGGGVCFGPVVSLDITPDSNGLPAGLTLAQFKNLMRSGINPVDGSTLQVMPWPAYTNMQDSDLSAIYAYLTAIPSVPASANTCS